jgi:hypothetical protein
LAKNSDVAVPEGYEASGVEIPEGFQPQKGTVEDVARGVGSGILMSPADLAGMPGDLAKYAREKGAGSVVDAIMSTIPGYSLYRSLTQPKLSDLVTDKKRLPIDLPTSEDIKQGIPGYKSLDYEPESHAGEIGKRVGSFLGGSVLAPWKTGAQLAANVGRFGLAPAVGSEAAGELAHQYAPNLEGTARLLGGMFGSAKASKYISPNASTAPPASRAAYAQHVEDVENALGHKATPGERSNSILQRIKEEESNPDRYLENREAITRGATKAVGPEFEAPTIDMATRDAAGNVVKPGWLERTRSAIGKKFEDVTSNPRNNLELDATNGPQTSRAVINLTNKYRHSAGYDQDAVTALENAANHVSDTLNANGTSARSGGLHLTAEQYQRMRSSLMDTAMNSEGQKSQALHDFIKVLDDSFDRSLRTYNPNDLSKIQTARKQWRAMLTVEKAANRADVDHLTAANLDSAAQQTYGKTAHLEGKTPFWWAPSAKAVFNTLPNSNTARRAEARKSLEDFVGGILGPAGYFAGLHLGGGAEHAVGGLLMTEKQAPMVAKMAHPYIEHIASQPWFQAYAGNQILAGAPSTAGKRLVKAEALRTPEYVDEEKKRPRLPLTVGPGLLGENQ